jgi:hypothetical protein
MIEGPKIAKESAGFPNPVEDGRICELCGGRTFSILHGWEPGNRWNPTTIPIAVWEVHLWIHFSPSSARRNRILDDIVILWDRKVADSKD